MIVDKNVFDRPLDEIFMSHRDGIDPENYRVGVYNDKIYVWNPDLDIVMEYYYDDKPEDFSINLKGKLNISKDIYTIYKNGNVFSSAINRFLKVSNDNSGYPRVSIERKSAQLHKLLATLFIPNLSPSTRIVVDHIDRNKLNYSLDNLRWATIKENCNNQNRPIWSGNRLFIAYSDINRTIECGRYTDEKLFSDVLPKTENIKNLRHNINNSVKDNTRSYGYYWKVIDLDVNNYLDSIGVTDVDESLWVLHYTGNFYVHPLGLFKNSDSNIIRVGNIYSKDGKLQYRRYGGKKYRRAAHRLVAEVFLNGNTPIDNSLVIDHLNANTLDNRAVNLKICTQKENLNNPITLSRNSKKIKNKDGKIFIGLKACANYYGYKSTVPIRFRINGKLPNPEGLKFI